MRDFVFVALTVLMFAIAVGYVYACERLRWTDDSRIRCNARHLRTADGLPGVRTARAREIL